MKKISKLIYFNDEDTEMLNEIAAQASSKGQNRLIKKLIKMGLILQKSGYELSDSGALLRVVNFENIKLDNTEKKNSNIIIKDNVSETTDKNSDGLEAINQVSLSHLK